MVFAPSKQELVEFYLSSKEYEFQAIKSLVLLKIFKKYYETNKNTEINKLKNKKCEGIDLEILKVVVEAHRNAQNINDKPLLRNFLWNN